MSKKIHVRPGKGQSKFGFVFGIIFCLIGLVVVIPTFGLIGILWTAIAAYITYVNYRNGFTDKQIDSHVIEIEENDKDIMVTNMNQPQADNMEKRLNTLAELYTKGLITQEEYAQKKKEILDEL